MASIKANTAAVVGQQGDHLLVSIPMSGFPDGMRLTPGTMVVLADLGHGLVALPMTQIVREGGERLESASETVRWLTVSVDGGAQQVFAHRPVE